MQYEASGDGEWVVLPRSWEHFLLHELTEMALEAAATGGAPLAAEEAETYLLYHSYGRQYDSSGMVMEADDLIWLRHCVQEGWHNLDGEVKRRAACSLAERMQQLESQHNVRGEY